MTDKPMPVTCRCGMELSDFVDEWGRRRLKHGFVVNPGIDHCILEGFEFFARGIAAWNALMSREADIIAGAEAMREKAAKMSGGYPKWGHECATHIRRIDPAAIAKEVMEKKNV